MFSCCVDLPEFGGRCITERAKRSRLKTADTVFVEFTGS